MQYIKFGVWCAVSATGVIESIHFSNTVHAERDNAEVRTPYSFWKRMSWGRNNKGYSSKKVTTVHPANNLVNHLRNIF